MVWTEDIIRRQQDVRVSFFFELFFVIRQDKARRPLELFQNPQTQPPSRENINARGRLQKEMKVERSVGSSQVVAFLAEPWAGDGDVLCGFAGPGAPATRRAWYARDSPVGEENS